MLAAGLLGFHCYACLLKSNADLLKYWCTCVDCHIDNVYKVSQVHVKLGSPQLGQFEAGIGHKVPVILRRLHQLAAAAVLSAIRLTSKQRHTLQFQQHFVQLSDVHEPMHSREYRPCMLVSLKACLSTTHQRENPWACPARGI